MLTCILFLFYAWLPGYLLAAIFFPREHRLLLASPLSILIFIAGIALAYLFRLPTDQHNWVLLTLYIAVGTSWWLFRKRGADPDSTPFDRAEIFGLVIVFCLVGAYSLIAGPYDELAADFYRHLERINYVNKLIEDGSIFSRKNTAWLLGDGALYHYILLEQLIRYGRETQEQAIYLLNFCTSLTWAAGIYCFGILLFRNCGFSSRKTTVTAVLATTFYFLHFGTNIFAYSRYYAIAPAMLGFGIYLAATVLAITYLQNRSSRLSNPIIAILLTAAAAMYHLQEALFILVTITAYCVTTVVAARIPPPPVSNAFIDTNRVRVVAALLVLSFLVSVVVARFIHPGPPVIDVTKIMNLGSISPSLNGLFVLGPGVQFYETITAWGLAVYVLALLYSRVIRLSAFLVAGLVIPFLTVFNPLFVDLLLRSEGPHTVWRVLFTVPLGYAAAIIAVTAASELRTSGLPLRAMHCIALAALLALLLPFSSGHVSAPNSRISTLRPVPEGNSYRHWRDLISYLNSLEQEQTILSDPVTSYGISAFTRHKTFNTKFWWNTKYQYNFDDFLDHPRDYKAWLLIVNTRDGHDSSNGYISGHWPRDIMQTSAHYPEMLLDYLEVPGDHIRQIWASTGISVYKIIKPGKSNRP